VWTLCQIPTGSPGRGRPGLRVECEHVVRFAKVVGRDGNELHQTPPDMPCHGLVPLVGEDELHDRIGIPGLLRIDPDAEAIPAGSSQDGATSGMADGAPPPWRLCSGWLSSCGLVVAIRAVYFGLAIHEKVISEAFLNPS